MLRERERSYACLKVRQVASPPFWPFEPAENFWLWRFKGLAVSCKQAIRSIKFVSLWPPIPGFKQCCTRRQHLRFPRAQDHPWRQRLRCRWPENQPCLQRCPCGSKDLAWRNDLRRPGPQTEPQQPRSTRPERLPGLAINSIFSPVSFLVKKSLICLEGT